MWSRNKVDNYLYCTNKRGVKTEGVKQIYKEIKMLNSYSCPYWEGD